MANQDHIRHLMEGSEHWNRWRSENPAIIPDLDEADLKGCDLSNVNLIGANLASADLSWDEDQIRNEDGDTEEIYHFPTDLTNANLSGAFLRGANLTMADFTNANLQGANLSSTVLNGTNFINADLNSVDLSFARFESTKLINTNLTAATVYWTTFTHIDFRTIKGLEAIYHDGPSTISIDSIYLSQGQIPAAFLRGVGIPDQLITYIRSLVQTPIEYHSCFISYSSKDENFAERLYNDLQSSGIRCWFAREDMKTGDRILSHIEESIRLHEKLLLVLSEHSIQSEWVGREVELALAKEARTHLTVLFPIRLDDAIQRALSDWPAFIQNSLQIADFSRWREEGAYQAAFQRILDDLKKRPQNNQS